MNKELPADMRSYFDYSYTDEPREGDVGEDDVDEFDDPELVAERFVRPRDRQVEKRVSLAWRRKAASKEYR
jgi:hypothetical protein